MRANAASAAAAMTCIDVPMQLLELQCIMVSQHHLQGIMPPPLAAHTSVAVTCNKKNTYNTGHRHASRASCHRHLPITPALPLPATHNTRSTAQRLAQRIVPPPLAAHTSVTIAGIIQLMKSFMLLNYLCRVATPANRELYKL